MDFGSSFDPYDIDEKLFELRRKQREWGARLEELEKLLKQIRHSADGMRKVLGKVDELLHKAEDGIGELKRDIREGHGRRVGSRDGEQQSFWSFMCRRP